MAKSGFSMAGFSYRYFLWAGRPLNRWLRLDKTLDAAKMPIYPEAYASIVAFSTVISAIVGVLAFILFATYLIPLSALTFIRAQLPPLVFSVFLALPLITLALGISLPKLNAQNRASNLDVEVPFASAYISVMATGGVSPFRSLQKLKDVKLLPNVAKASKMIDMDVRAMGVDPVAAMENSAKNLPSREYKELLLGYSATLRSGGDVVHHLLRRTEVMFNDKVAKMKTMIDRIGLLMEAYIAITILAGLSFYAMFTTTFALEPFFGGVAGFGGETFFLFAWVLLPVISIMFLYLTDTAQPKYPVSDMGAYKVFAASSPLMLILIIGMFMPFMNPDLRSLPLIGTAANFVVWVRESLGLIVGYEAPIGLGFALIIGTIPAAIAHVYYSRRSAGVEQDISNFLRDLVEARKTGLSPERCIEELSSRDYGRLSKYLKVISRQLQWGLPFGTIYNTFQQKVRSWVALVNMYLLVDVIEVGGGAPETLETLAEFSETTASLEKEKKQMLRPMLFIPYVGAGILLFSVIVFLAFMKGVMSSFGHASISMGDYVGLLLPPLVILSYIMGLVTGKVSSGSIAAGFQHAIFLCIACIVSVWLSPYFSMPFESIVPK